MEEPIGHVLKRTEVKKGGLKHVISYEFELICTCTPGCISAITFWNRFTFSSRNIVLELKRLSVMFLMPVLASRLQMDLS